MRLSGEGVTISAAVRGVRIHASGLAAATSLNRDHRAPMWAACSRSVQPLAARSAFSSSGYATTGRSTPRFTSSSVAPGLSTPKTTGAGVSAG